MSNTKEQIIEQFIELTLHLKRYPSYTELEEIGLTTNSVRHHFRTMSRLIEVANKSDSRLNSQLFGSEVFTKRNLTTTREAVKDFNEFIITTAVSGCNVDMNAYGALKTWRDTSNGMLLFQPIKDPARPNVGDRMLFDSALKDERFAFDDVSLNDNVSLSAILQSAKQLNPHTGLGRIANRNGLNIIASPKQQLTPLANMSGNGSGFLFSPGAVTKPNYSTRTYMSHRTAYLSEAMHTMGAAVVKVVSPTKYLFTNIQFEADGSFTHLGTRYSSGGIDSVDTDFMVLGDLHASELKDLKPILDSIKFFKPKTLVLHDVFSAVSISPFNRKSAIERKLAAESHQLAETLHGELMSLNAVLITLRRTLGSEGQIVIVRGNHDMFLDEWITRGTYASDVDNVYTGVKLAAKLMDNPEIPAIRHGLELVGADLSKVRFLQADESFRINGYELGMHGHVGSQGQRNPSLEKCVREFGPCVVGHKHVSEIMPMGGFRVGTMLGLAGDKPSYARKGSCQWSRSFAVGYSTGQVQLIQLVNNKFEI